MSSDFVLYSYFRSSASYRVRIALQIKEIDYIYQPVHLLNDGGEQHKSDYVALNPSHEVPTLVHRGVALAQSIAIIDYLDQIIPTPRLFPAEATTRAKVIQLCEVVNSGVQPLHNLRVLQELSTQFGAKQEQKDEWTRHWIRYGLQTLESLLARCSGLYSVGDHVSAADCFLIPHLANADRFAIDLNPYPTLRRVRAQCEGISAFSKAAPSAQPDFPGA